MDYKGFDIIKKRKDLYWVMYNGFILGSATSEKGACILIDELTYCEI